MKTKKRVRPPVRIEVTPEDRFHLINDAAYFRMLRRGRRRDDATDEAGCWEEVEGEIDSILAAHRAN
jgi:hypothetical protein